MYRIAKVLIQPIYRDMIQSPILDKVTSLTVTSHNIITDW